jgi:hypothetical protein
MRRLIAIQCVPSLVCLALAGAAAALQEPKEVVQEEPAVAAAPAAPAPEVKQAPGARGKLLATLKYDRRPSAILAARSRPAGAPDATATEAWSPAGGMELPGGIEGSFVGVDTGGGAVFISRPGVTVFSSSGSVTLSTASSVPPTVAAGAEPATDPAAAGAPANALSAEEAAKKAAADAAEAKAVQDEGKALQRNVTLGDWAAVKAYLAGLPEADAKAGYERIVASLLEGPPPVQTPFANWAEKNFFAVEDIAGLIASAPLELEQARLNALGTLTRQCVDGAGLVDPLLMRLRAALAGGEFRLGKSEVAAILIAAGYPVQAGEFLPTIEEARAEDDRTTLNLISRHCLAQHDKDRKAGWLVQAWQALQAVLAAGTVSDQDKNEALQRAVEVAPRIQSELGAAWLAESFTTRPERGMEILAAIGSSNSKGLVDQARNGDYRLKGLELQRTAGEALLKDAPELAASWKDTLTLLAANWLREAEYSNQWDTSTNRAPAMQRDAYGNIYYYDMGGGVRINSNQPLALRTVDVLAQMPSTAWLELVEAALRPRLERATAQLLLKLGDEREAFPHIERVAASHPVHAKELAEEFLRVWIKNHDPNEQQGRTNPYMFMYGFEQRQSGIPLTRSKQERNLVELSEWIARLEALPIEAAGEELDEELVAKAFTTAHSSAEVYRIETIERVFGALENLGTKTQAQLVQTMRTNLGGVWRDPAQQEEKKTRRRQKDIQAEVVRGYEVARTVVERALGDHPDDWALLLARASVLHDENDYQRELDKKTDFAPRRTAAFAEFHRAAERYAAVAGELDAGEQTSKVYELWFYAALGACDLERVSHDQSVAEAEIPLLRAAIESLGGEAARHHADLFANSLTTRVSAVAPAVKYRYVRHGLEIVPTSDRTRDARSLYEYYRDLVTEIRLETRLEGPVEVGQLPFGVFVDLRHTREIEREAGGFGKYFINQNTQAFAYNYGRPTEDYRDKFETAARAVLEEHFEVLSVTFNAPETHSRSLPEYGWRVTPYAYLLLKARNPSVDRLPPLRFDLDFRDTSGYAVLPIESAPLGLEARTSAERPFHELSVTQTLDERQAQEKKLVLEVHAKAKGLVPSLDSILELAPPGFVVAETADQGVSVTQFDQEGDGIDVLSERTWLLTLRAADDLAELPAEFRFGTPKVAEAKLEYQRFVDADLAAVGPLVALERSYGERGAGALRPWLIGSLAVLGAGGVCFWLLRARRRTAPVAARFRVPEPITPFTVLGLLRDIQARNGIAAQELRELELAIQSIERGYFADDGEGPELERLAEEWVERAS